MRPRNRAGYAKPLFVFLVVVAGLSAIFETMLIVGGSIHGASSMLALLLMWSPALAAVVAAPYTVAGFRGLGLRPGPVRYLAVGYLIPVAYAIIAYNVVWAAGLGRFVGDWPAHLPFVIVLGSIAAAISAFGEELGWRGFLVPRLASRYGFTVAALISGVIWAVWHLPLLLFTDYGGHGPQWYALACFVVGVIGLSFAMAWLRLRSGSVWPAVLLHAAHNLFVLNIFAPVMFEHAGHLALTGEEGAMMAVVGVVVGIVFWLLRGHIAAPVSPVESTHTQQVPAALAQNVTQE